MMPFWVLQGSILTRGPSWREIHADHAGDHGQVPFAAHLRFLRLLLLSASARKSPWCGGRKSLARKLLSGAECVMDLKWSGADGKAHLSAAASIHLLQ
jgi:hypothetical protein